MPKEAKERFTTFWGAYKVLIISGTGGYATVYWGVYQCIYSLPLDSSHSLTKRSGREVHIKYKCINMLQKSPVNSSGCKKDMTSNVRH